MKSSELYEVEEQDEFGFAPDEHQIRRDAVLRDLLSNTDAKVWLGEILFAAGFYAHGSTDPQDLAVREGARRLGKHILNDLLQADPTAYIQIQQAVLDIAKDG